MHGAIHVFDRLPQVDVSESSGDGRTGPGARGVPLVGVIRNPRSHGNSGAAESYASLPGVMVANPSMRSELPQIIADFAEKRVDYIAIDGGDGTVRDVLTCGAGVFGEAWPNLILLPSGKTNALAYDLGIASGWSLADALDAARRGTHVERRPLVVAQHDNQAAQVRGFVMGAGAFTRAISLGQDAHRFGAFNAAAVGVTTLWSAAQAFFGTSGNPWRRGTRMKLVMTGEGELEHRGGGPADERYVMFASSLENFPAGLKPFGDLSAAIRMAVLDNARRTALLRLPMVFRGRISEATRRKGFHTLGTEGFDFDIGDSFILDGEAFPAGSYRVTPGPRLRFVVP